jgi:hypothetical protein
MKRLIVLGLLVASLLGVNLFLPEATSTAEAYWCGTSGRLCQANSQCRGFCGPGVPASWEICFQGCCTCAG